jgi:hypothetical protein
LCCIRCANKLVFQHDCFNINECKKYKYQWVPQWSYPKWSYPKCSFTTSKTQHSQSNSVLPPPWECHCQLYMYHEQTLVDSLLAVAAMCWEMGSTLKPCCWQSHYHLFHLTWPVGHTVMTVDSNLWVCLPLWDDCSYQQVECTQQNSI